MDRREWCPAVKNSDEGVVVSVWDAVKFITVSLRFSQ